MLRYVLRRIVVACGMLVGLSLIIFLLPAFWLVNRLRKRLAQRRPKRPPEPPPPPEPIQISR